MEAKQKLYMYSSSIYLNTYLGGNTVNGKIGFAIIGCGRIAPKHVAAIESLEKDAKVVACCDINEERARKIAQETGCKWTTKYEDILKMDDVDIVSICTPSGMHAQQSIMASNAEKHVLTEKPMALNLKDADLMIAAAKNNGVKLFVVKQNRYNSPMAKLKDAVQQGRFGKIFLANTTVRWSRPQAYYDQDPWRGTLAMDCGVLMNQASHHIDLLQWLVGPVKSVIAKTATMTHNIEAEDLGIAILNFKNGAMGVIEATTCIYPKNIEGSVSIFGDKGSVKVGGIAVNKMEHWEFEDFRNDDGLVHAHSTNPPNVYGFGHIEVFKNIIGAIKNGKVPFVDGSEGRKSLELIKATYKSARIGKEVFLPLSDDDSNI